MKRISFLTAALIAAFACSLVLSACSKPADDEITAAENMIKKAEDAGAMNSSPRLLEKAKDLVAEAKKENDQGTYSDARKKAESALMRAEQAEKNAEKLGGAPLPHKGHGGGGDEGGGE